MDADSEREFINSLGFPYCTAGPNSQSNTALIQVSPTTKTVDSIATTLQLLAASRTFAPVSLSNLLDFHNYKAVSCHLNEVVRVKSMAGERQIFLFPPCFKPKLWV